MVIENTIRPFVLTRHHARRCVLHVGQTSFDFTVDLGPAIIITATHSACQLLPKAIRDQGILGATPSHRKTITALKNLKSSLGHDTSEHNKQ